MSKLPNGLKNIQRKYEPISRDSWYKNAQYEANVVPFELKFLLQPLRKSRLIVKRDEWGRIVESMV